MFIDDDKYVLVFVPNLNDKGKWTGIIDVYRQNMEEMPYDEETKSSMLDFINLTTACIELCNQDIDFQWKAHIHKLKMERRNKKLHPKNNCEIKTLPKIISPRKAKKTNTKTAKIFQFKRYSKVSIKNELP